MGVIRVRIINSEARCPYDSCGTTVKVWQDAEGFNEKDACEHYVPAIETCGRYAEFRWIDKCDPRSRKSSSQS